MDADVTLSLNRVVARALLFDDLRPSQDKARIEFEAAARGLNDWTGKVRERIDAKRANVLEVDDAEVTQAVSVPGAALETVSREHNQRVEGHAELVTAAAQQVERHYLKKAEAAVQALVDESETVSADALRLAGEVSSLREKVAEFEAVDGDPSPSAKVLTERVARLLGRNELKFESYEDRYRVTRLGKPAHGLSVGERTAITLVHFLESVARFDNSAGKAIVVIDDPVSSLDSDIFMGVSTSIWTETVSKEHVAQLFLLTHNFELFRQWDIQLGGLPDALKKQIPSRLYEIKSQHRVHSGVPRREPVLVGWPPSEKARKKVRSTYHHAFIAVSEIKQKLQEDDSLENRLDAQLLFPNVIRRLLETFMAFKRPGSAANFNGAMQDAASLLSKSGYAGDPDALRQRLTRYTHAYSHSDTPHTELTVSPDEVKTAIGAVFTFMRHVDEEHFDGLCAILELDPLDLVDHDPAPLPEQL